MTRGGTQDDTGLEHRHGIDRRPGRVGDAEGQDVDQELPAIAGTAGFGEVVQPGVVKDPEAERDDAYLVDRVGEALVGGRLDVVAGVGAEHGDASLAQQWQQLGQRAGAAGLARVDGASLLALTELAGTEEEYVAL